MAVDQLCDGRLDLSEQGGLAPLLFRQQDRRIP
jgi:hypothetical protein